MRLQNRVIGELTHWRTLPPFAVRAAMAASGRCILSHGTLLSGCNFAQLRMREMAENKPL